MHFEVKRIKKMIDFSTPLGEIPREWLQNVESNIERENQEPCWIWIGAHDSNGYPKMCNPNNKSERIYVRRYVASIFFSYPPKLIVYKTCDVRNCVHPKHIDIR